jgi:hypothetical protein
MRTVVNGIAIVAAGLPALVFLGAAASGGPNGEYGIALLMTVAWSGFVAAIWWVLTRIMDKGEEALRFAGDHVERRTRSMEQQVDAETLGHVAGAGKLADESETARAWTKRTDAFGRIVGRDDD